MTDAPVDFDTSVRSLDGQVVVSVLGEIDMASGPLLWACLAEAIPDAHERLVVDLSGTTFIDSTAMALFARAHKRLRRQGAELVLGAPNTSARRVLRITGLDTVITIEGGAAAARPSPPIEADGGSFLPSGPRHPLPRRRR